MAGGPLIERAVVAVQLDSVTLLEAIVEVSRKWSSAAAASSGNSGKTNGSGWSAIIERLQRGAAHSAPAC